MRDPLHVLVIPYTIVDSDIRVDIPAHTGPLSVKKRRAKPSSRYSFSQQVIFVLATQKMTTYGWKTNNNWQNKTNFTIIGTRYFLQRNFQAS